MMVTLRKISDLPTLMDWRAEVIRTVFGEEASSALLDANREYYKRHIDDDTHIAIIASFDGTDCGCGAICLTNELPSPDNPSGKCAYLMNIYVREAFRKHGVAHKIVAHLVDEAKKRVCNKIYLETTSEGKPVYTTIGFRDMPDMMKYYDTTIY